MVDRRRRNINWTVCSEDGAVSFDAAQLAVLMDIREVLQEIRNMARCYRIPRALDSVIELGLEARRRKRAAAKKRAAPRKRK